MITEIAHNEQGQPMIRLFETDVVITYEKIDELNNRK